MIPEGTSPEVQYLTTGAGEPRTAYNRPKMGHRGAGGVGDRGNPPSGSAPARPRAAGALRIRFPLLLLAALAAFTVGFASRADAYVYWTNWGGDKGTTIGRAKLDGGGVDQRFIVDANAPCGVAVDAKQIVWANSAGEGRGSKGAIGLAHLDGSMPVQNFINGPSSPCGVAVDDKYIYWANGGLDQGSTIGRASTEGIDIDESFITGASSPCGVAVDDEHIYWANSRADSIGRAKLDGSGVNQRFVDAAIGRVCGVAVDDTYVYFASIDGLVGRAELDNPRENQVLVDGANTPCGVAVDDTHLYWGSANGDTIGRAKLDGSGANHSFITGASQPCGVAVDALPSRRFSFGGVKRNGKRGTARLTVKVPGPGKVKLHRTKGVKRRSKRATGADRLRHRVAPAPGARKRLRRLGKVRVRVQVTYTPDGGEPRVKRRNLVLKRR